VDIASCKGIGIESAFTVVSGSTIKEVKKRATRIKTKLWLTVPIVG
jgi:hypothetical protein